MELIDRVAQRLKLRDLRLLEAVVRWKSMAKAAAQLNLTQPAVSKAISELEGMLGVRLLDRSRQGIQPTPHGRALLRRGVAIFDELRQGMAEFEFLSDPAAGSVRIAASEPMAAGLLPAIVTEVNRQHPRIALYVTQSPIGSLEHGTPQYRDLRERNVDLVLGTIVRPIGEGDLETERLFGDRSIVAVGRQSRWLRRREVSLGDLADELWCLPPPDTPVGQRCIEAFRSGGVEFPRSTVFAVSLQLQIGLLATGRYLTMFPDSLMRHSAKRLSIRALPLELPLPPIQTGIITLKNRTLSPAARLFVECTRAVAKTLAKVN